jgi:hypothetical protein
VPGLVGLGSGEASEAHLGRHALGRHTAAACFLGSLSLIEPVEEDVLLQLRPVVDRLVAEPVVVLFRVETPPLHEGALDGVGEGEGAVTVGAVGVVLQELVPPIAPVIDRLLAEGVEERGADPLRMILQAVNVAEENGLYVDGGGQFIPPLNPSAPYRKNCVYFNIMTI